MFKEVWTLMRGRANDAADDFADRHAIAILRQQIRDSAAAVTAARRALAIAMAHQRQETERHEIIKNDISDLEGRALAALEQNKAGLAREAAEAIANLEAERDTSEKAQSVFSTEISRLKGLVRKAEGRLRDLERGLRLAAATGAAQKLQISSDIANLANLSDAEQTLERLQNRQKEFDLVQAAQAELGTSECPESLREKLAEAGCGQPIHTSADDVLERLKRQLQSGKADNQ